MLSIIHVSIQMLYVGEMGTRGMGESGGGDLRKHVVYVNSYFTTRTNMIWFLFMVIN